MSARQRLNELAEAKRLLALQGDLHRSLLRLDGCALRARFASLSAARAKLEAGRPLLFAGAVLAGVLAARRWRTLLRWAPTAVAAYRWLCRLTTK
jgi:hypothetical protein